MRRTFLGKVTYVGRRNFFGYVNTVENDYGLIANILWASTSLERGIRGAFFQALKYSDNLVGGFKVCEICKLSQPKIPYLPIIQGKDML